jgi:hypothetical protein
VSAQTSLPYPQSDDEFVGPFPSWINVTQYGATGNGVADETTALQAAFDAVGNFSSAGSVIYLPPGTYRISSTLTINYKINISVIGADPQTTKIVWAGAPGGTMLRINGVAYSRFNRITWDGQNIANIAVDQSWDGLQPHFDTGNEYADDAFTGVAIGLRGGFLGNGFAETAIMRCKFIGNNIAGISLGNFNALDIWAWDCLFENCAIGITNAYGAGNFKVYRSIFKNSTEADIKIGNTGEFSFRDNASLNSQAFIIAAFTGNPSPISIQGNMILDPISNTAIDIGNQGPVSFIDNIIRSRPGSAGPVVRNNSWPSSDFFSIGNTFTLPNPVDVNWSIVLDTVVALNTLANLSLPSLQATAPNLNRQVYEVPAGANAVIIQNIINTATRSGNTRPVVHFAYGIYSISSTITIPAGTDLQLVGDGDGDAYPTLLQWSGNSNGPVLKIMGPTKATLRDIAVNGNGIVSNIIVTNAGQTGSIGSTSQHFKSSGERSEWDCCQ